MRIFRVAMSALVALSMSGVPAFAGELRDSVAAAATAAAKSDAQKTPLAPSSSSSGKALVWGGTALFVGGMTYGLYEFMNNKNGSYAEFGEAAATNKKAGAAGLSVAFAGGTMMLLGHHASAAPSLSVGHRRVGLAKTVTW